MEYTSFCGHVRGASHVEKGLPCEDYAACYAEGGRAIGVISDGHGDSMAFRAADGARMACEGTLDILKRFIGNDEPTLRAIENSEDQFFFNLNGLVLRTWLDKAAADYDARPFSDAEISPLTEKDRAYLLGGQNKFIKAYGCTLIAVYVTPLFWFCLQIGDGTCTVCREDGLSEQPVPAGAGQAGNITNSLCQSDAMNRFVHYFDRTPPLGVFVASDGVDESCKPLSVSVQLPELYREISEPFYLNEENAGQSLGARLERLTQEGCGDDVCVAAVIATEKFLSPPKLSQDQLNRLEALLDERIDSKRALIKNNAAALRQAEGDGSQSAAGIERIRRIAVENEKELQALLEEKEKIRVRLAEHGPL